MLPYVQLIIIPFVEQMREFLEVDKPAVVIMTTFSQKNDRIVGEP